MIPNWVWHYPFSVIEESAWEKEHHMKLSWWDALVVVITLHNGSALLMSIGLGICRNNFPGGPFSSCVLGKASQFCW